MGNGGNARSAPVGKHGLTGKRAAGYNALSGAQKRSYNRQRTNGLSHNAAMRKVGGQTLGAGGSRKKKASIKVPKKSARKSTRKSTAKRPAKKTTSKKATPTRKSVAKKSTKKERKRVTRR